jgi:hypothetical protein
VNGDPAAGGRIAGCLQSSGQLEMDAVLGPHMHLLGRSITVELNPGTPGARMLLDQPRFNFGNLAGVARKA